MDAHGRLLRNWGKKGGGIVPFFVVDVYL